MTLHELRKTIQTRELKVGEILSGSWDLLIRRLGAFFLLSIIVFLPSNLITEIFFSRLPAEPDIQDLVRLYGLQIVLNLYTMISLCITAFMVENQLKNDEVEPFGSCFYRGIKNWPRFLITMVIVALILGAALCVVMMLGMIMPIFMLPAMVLVFIITIIGVVLIYDVCTASSLRRYMLLPCFNYVRSILQDHLGKSVGVILLLTLISGLVATPLVSMVNRLMVVLQNPMLTIAVNTLVSSAVSIVNIYTNIGVVLFFMNLEFLKYRELGAIE